MTTRRQAEPPRTRPRSTLPRPPSAPSSSRSGGAPTCGSSAGRPSSPGCSPTPSGAGSGCRAATATPVLLIPGFLAGDQSLSVMATWLRRLGYRPRRAGIAFNVRCSDTAVDRLERVLHHAHLSSGRKVAIVGHSRGGHFAKALASRRPDEVSQVISMGSGLDEPFDISEPTRLAVEGVRRHGRAPRPRARAAGLLHAHLPVPVQPGLPHALPRVGAADLASTPRATASCAGAPASSRTPAASR